MTPSLLMPIYTIDFYECKKRNSLIKENASVTLVKVAISLIAIDIFIIGLYLALMSRNAIKNHS